MKTIIDLILVAVVTIYIVDLSGFTDTWLKVLSHYTGRKITELKPFSCSLCMVWWVGIAFLLVSRKWSLPMLVVVSMLSFLSVPIGQFLLFVRQAILKLVNILMDLL